VDLANFGYSTPKMFENIPEAKKIYDEHMISVQNTYKNLKQILEEQGFKGEQVNENCRYVLPMATHTDLYFGMNYEALVNFLGKRLCTRSQHSIRQLAIAMRTAVLEVLPELKDYLVVKCVRDLYCTESHSCGLYPKKDELLKIIESGKKRNRIVSLQEEYWNNLNQ
jgi:thymidylate synthase (FAD)